MAADASLPRLTLVSGAGCGLCDRAEALIAKVAKDYPLELAVLKIDGDPALEARYRARLPVVLIDGAEAMALKVTEFWLRKALKARSGAV